MLYRTHACFSFPTKQWFHHISVIWYQFTVILGSWLFDLSSREFSCFLLHLFCQLRPIQRLSKQRKRFVLPLRYGRRQQWCISQTRGGIAHLRQERHHPLRWYAKVLVQEMSLCVIPYFESFHLTRCLLLVWGNKGYTQFIKRTLSNQLLFSIAISQFPPVVTVLQSVSRFMSKPHTFFHF